MQVTSDSALGRSVRGSGLGSIEIDWLINDDEGPRANRDSSELLSEIMRRLPKRRTGPGSARTTDYQVDY